MHIRAFLGFVQWYSMYIDRFGHLSAPFTDAHRGLELKKTGKSSWLSLSELNFLRQTGKALHLSRSVSSRMIFIRLGSPRSPIATPGWGVGVCVCLCAHSACTLPLLAGVCGVGVCAWPRVSAVPRHSWLGCWGLCVLVCALPLYPATPGRDVRCGCVGLDSRFGCAPPLLAGMLGFVCACVRAPLVPRHSCGVGMWAWARVSAAPRQSWLGCWAVCVLVCALRLYLATAGWGVRCGCVCFDLGFGCAPPLLAGALGCVCACVRAPLVPRHSWLGCAVLVCGLWLGSRRRHATPGWGVGVCVCLCVRSACTLPLLAGLSGVGVCAWARAWAAPRQFLAGVLGWVCVCVRAPLVPRHSWLGCAVGVCA